MADPRASLIIELKDLVSKGLAKVGGSFGKLAADVERAKFVFAGVAAGIGALGGIALKASGQFEQWQVAFTTMLGSADKADILLNRIRDFAEKTPFELPQVVEGSKRLMAFGIAAQDIIPTMRMLGDISSGLGVDVGRLVNVFGQVRAAGRLMGQESLQFIQAGVPMLEILAKKAGKTTGEMKKAMEAGAISFRDVQKALEDMTEEGGRFFGMMDKQSATLFGRISELKDVIDEVWRAIGGALLPAAKGLVDATIPLVRGISDWIKQNRALATIIMGGAGLVAAFSAMAAGLGVILAFSAPFIAALKVMVLMVAALLNPWLAVAAVLISLKTNFLDLRETGLMVMRQLGRSLETLVEAFTKAAQGDFRGAWDTMVKAEKQAGLALRAGMDNTGNAIKAKWEELKAYFGTEVIKPKIDTGLEDPAAKENRIKAIEEQAAKELELFMMTEEEKKRFKQEQDLLAQEDKIARMAQELRELGAHERAKELLVESAEARKKKVRAKFLKDQLGSTKTMLGMMVSLSSSGSKDMARIAKAGSIAQATINTLVAATKAYSQGGFFFGPIFAGIMMALGMAKVAQISATPLATGGVVLPSEGGTLARLAEAGGKEGVLPLDDPDAMEAIREGLGLGAGVTLQVGTLVADDLGLEELARVLDEKLYTLRRNKGSAFGD